MELIKHELFMGVFFSIQKRKTFFIEENALRSGYTKVDASEKYSLQWGEGRAVCLYNKSKVSNPCCLCNSYFNAWQGAHYYKVMCLVSGVKLMMRHICAIRSTRLQTNCIITNKNLAKHHFLFILTLLYVSSRNGSMYEKGKFCLWNIYCFFCLSFLVVQIILLTRCTFVGMKKLACGW